VRVRGRACSQANSRGRGMSHFMNARRARSSSARQPRAGMTLAKAASLRASRMTQPLSQRARSSARPPLSGTTLSGRPTAVVAANPHSHRLEVLPLHRRRLGDSMAVMRAQEHAHAYRRPSRLSYI
jgi:hypothetical protein